jgi:hypothetical protein
LPDPLLFQRLHLLVAVAEKGRTIATHLLMAGLAVVAQGLRHLAAQVVLVIHHQFQLQRFKDMMVVMGLVRTRPLLEVAAAVQTELVLMVQAILLEMAVLHKYQLFLVHRFTMQAAAVVAL